MALRSGAFGVGAWRWLWGEGRRPHSADWGQRMRTRRPRVSATFMRTAGTGSFRRRLRAVGRRAQGWGGGHPPSPPSHTSGWGTGTPNPLWDPKSALGIPYALGVPMSPWGSPDSFWEHHIPLGSSNPLWDHHRPLGTTCPLWRPQIPLWTSNPL